MPTVLERDTLAPEMFPYQAAERGHASTVSTVRPFGLSRAVPVRPVAQPLPALTLCPERQINITSDGVPFIFEPSMKSAFSTTSQTQEDHQLDEETENDTD